VYLCYIAKAKKKGRTKKEVDEIIHWLTGYKQKGLLTLIKKQTTLEDFYGNAKLNPARKLITGVVCGVRIEEIKDPLMREIRYMDKLIDETRKGEADGEDFKEILIQKRYIDFLNNRHTIKALTKS